MSSPVEINTNKRRLEELLSAPHYALRCLSTGASFSDDVDPASGNLPLLNPDAPTPAFLRAEYTSRRLELLREEFGLYRYASWLPVRRSLPGSSSPVTYKSSALAEALGLQELYITFSGYWPEKGCRMISGTFKECEAYSVAGRLGGDFRSRLVIASAGNTARAFYNVCCEHGIPLVIVIPQENLDKLWSSVEKNECVTVIAAGDGADYSDAIALAGIVTELPEYVPEGGAKNVARRDGMGTTMLSATARIGRIPDHYVQAVGSGTGAIAAWEANRRLIADGRFGNHLAKLHLSQNAPFTLLTDSWNRGTRELVKIDEADAKNRIRAIGAAVLANRKPPYSPVGGLFDALTDCGGEMYSITNNAAAAAAALFEECEGIDLAPAAAVATASLVEAAESGKIRSEDTVMLNVTGGGLRRISEELAPTPVEPDLVLFRDEWNRQRVAELLTKK